MKRVGLALVFAIALTGQSFGDTSSADPEASLALELAAVKKTQGLLSSKYLERKAEMRTRVRALYKLSRASWPRIWFEPDIRQSTSRWLGAARRITRRDIAELALLENEIAVTALDEERLTESGLALTQLGEGVPLQWPVAGSKVISDAGDHRGASRRVRLRQRGVLLQSPVGAIVTAPAAGRVRYVGPISGLGQSIIIEHGPAEAPSGLTILGGVRDPRVKASDQVGAGDVIAQTLGTELYLEHRVGSMTSSFAVDPEPLLHD